MYSFNSNIAIKIIKKGKKMSKNHRMPFFSSFFFLLYCTVNSLINIDLRCVLNCSRVAYSYIQNFDPRTIHRHAIHYTIKYPALFRHKLFSRLSSVHTPGVFLEKHSRIGVHFIPVYSLGVLGRVRTLRAHL